MSKEYILKLFNDLGITMEDFKAEADRLEQIWQSNNSVLGTQHELDTAKDVLKIFEQGYFEVREVQYQKKLHIKDDDRVRFYFVPNMDLVKVEVISKDGSNQTTTDPHVIDEIMGCSPWSQWIYNHISQTSHAHIKKEIRDLRRYLAQHQTQSADPVDDRFKSLDAHRTDKELYDMYYKYDPHNGYRGGLGLDYDHFIEILKEELK